MSQAHCYSYWMAAAVERSSVEAGPGGYSGYWYAFAPSAADWQRFSVLPTAGYSPTSVALRKPGYGGQISVEFGQECPALSGGFATKFVVVTVEDYAAVINSANVVAKLDGTEGIIVVAVIVLALLAGIFFGWKAVGRGAGRSG